MSADTHTHPHQLMSYELVYTSIHSSIKQYNTIQQADRVTTESRGTTSHVVRQNLQKRKLRVLNPARIHVFYWFNWLNLIGS